MEEDEGEGEGEEEDDEEDDEEQEEEKSDKEEEKSDKEEEKSDKEEEKADKDYSSMSNFPDNDALNKIKWPKDVSKSNFRSFMSTVSSSLTLPQISRTNER